jgi:hypothetical protein
MVWGIVRIGIFSVSFWIGSTLFGPDETSVTSDATRVRAPADAVEVKCSNPSNVVLVNNNSRKQTPSVGIRFAKPSGNKLVGRRINEEVIVCLVDDHRMSGGERVYEGNQP